MKRYLSNSNDYTSNEVLPLSDAVLFRTLAASTAETITVPSGAKLVVLTSIGANAYCRGGTGSPDNGPAVVPSGDGTALTGSTPLPDGMPRAFRCDDLSTISVISASAVVVMAEFYN